MNELVFDKTKKSVRKHKPAITEREEVTCRQSLTIMQ